MGLDFKKNAPQPQPQNTPAPVEAEVAQSQTLNIQPVEQYDIVAEREKMNQLVGSEEVDKIASQIEVYNMDTIVTFGAEAAEEISKVSDAVLHNTNMEGLSESNQLMKSLAKIMSSFDVEELKDDPNFFQKLFGNAKKQMEKIVSKYDTMGKEVEKIGVELRKYQTSIKQSNQSLGQMFEANVGFYHELVKYILAGEQGCKEIEAYIQQRQQDLETTGDNSIQFELDQLRQALSMLEQRVQDLRTAEMVAMQSIPMLKTMEFSNWNLYRKIDSAFIITLPVFKQALAQAVLLKRQKVQAEAMSALDEKTNELLLRNAQNTVDQAKLTARLASGSSIKVETLQQTWQIGCGLGISNT